MRALALLALSVWACDRPDAATDASGAETAQLRARAGETTVWIGDRLVRRGSELIASGRTSRNLTGGTVFVFDDVYGAFEQKSARRYDLRFSTTELTTLITGVQTFARFHFAPSSTRPDTLTGRVIASVRLGDFGGSGIYLEQPEVSGGSFRIRATSNRGLIAIEASAGGMPIDAALLSPTEAAIDLPIARAIDLVGTDDRLEVRARTATGPASKSARLDLMVSSFELTDGDPSVVWPSEAIVDDVALQAALSRADSRVASIRSDATALVGAARLEAFLDNVRRTIESQLEPYFDRRYPTAAERDQALDAEIELGIDAAYARPLD